MVPHSIRSTLNRNNTDRSNCYSTPGYLQPPVGNTAPDGNSCIDMASNTGMDGSSYTVLAGRTGKAGNSCTDMAGNNYTGMAGNTVSEHTLHADKRVLVGKPAPGDIRVYSDNRRAPQTYSAYSG